MQLYEATNGFMGESYVRCLVWANNEQEATEIARKAFKEDGERSYPERYWTNIELELIVDAEVDKEPFCTNVVDS